MSLASHTILFHLANALAPGRKSSATKPKQHRLVINDQSRHLWLRTYCGDLFVFHEVFLGNCYIIPADWGRNVRTVVDLGANIGLTTLYFAESFPNARFVCVEPDPNNTSLLRRNVDWLGDRVCVLEGAVSDQTGEALFETSEYSWGGKLLPYEHGAVSAVRCFTMDEIISVCDLDTIDILKVDIEGAEEQLFGADHEWLSRVKLIVIELHGGYSIERFQQDIAEHGFKVLPPAAEYGNRMIFAVRSDVLSAQAQTA